ncbi:PAS domain S-box protein [uncultured Desulfosarcina sp.]|uniref:PAS domain-containing protein n=1 Tax=uncultured Desulfosarcina sp. TaxID=218289 RepID=UPI0029C69BE7|nr:PAS domain S-box protein [uncultured Desulfosarcina sp.]
MPNTIKYRIKELERKHRLITENLVDAVWLINPESLKFEYITPSISRISGFGANETIGTSILERLTPESARRAVAMIAEIKAAGQNAIQASHSMELELNKKNGDTCWAEVRVKLVEEPDGPPKLVGVTRDISNRKNAELKLENQNQALARALAEKEELLKEVKVLRKLLPICSGCRRIRDENNQWWPLDEYVRAHTDTNFTHTICPSCKDIYYPDLKNRT